VGSGSVSNEARTTAIGSGVQNSSLDIVMMALIGGGDAEFTPYPILAAVFGAVI